MNLAQKKTATMEPYFLEMLDHENVIKMFDWEKARGSRDLLLVLEYCRGGDLKKFVDLRAQLSDEEILSAIKQISAGLHYCHNLSIVHRDLKP